MGNDFHWRDLSMDGRGRTRISAAAKFLAGIVIFSGSPYMLAATNLRWLGALTPAGGLSLLTEWAALMFSARSRVG
jgi:uncharacterized membrane protein YgdD (TMEM256/DUF423 family)